MKKIKFISSGTYPDWWFEVLMGKVVTGVETETGLFYVVQKSELIRVGMTPSDADTDSDSTTWWFPIDCAEQFKENL